MTSFFNYILIGMLFFLLNACATTYETKTGSVRSQNLMLDATHDGKDLVLTFPGWASESDKLDALNSSARARAIQKCPGVAYKLINVHSTPYIFSMNISTTRVNGISANIQCDEVIKDISTASFSKDKNNVNNLPECQGRYVSRWTNCFGTITIGNGSKYVGEFNNGKEHGRGIFYSSNGTILNQGIWADGKFAQSQTVQQYTDPNIETETLINEIQNPKKRQAPK
jgi:hypothetical protein